jgi:hypothetical protein
VSWRRDGYLEATSSHLRGRLANRKLRQGGHDAGWLDDRVGRLRTSATRKSCVNWIRDRYLEATSSSSRWRLANPGRRSRKVMTHHGLMLPSEVYRRAALERGDWRKRIVGRDRATAFPDYCRFGMPGDPVANEADASFLLRFRRRGHQLSNRLEDNPKMLVVLAVVCARCPPTCGQTPCELPGHPGASRKHA